MQSTLSPEDRAKKKNLYRINYALSLLLLHFCKKYLQKIFYANITSKKINY